jgi:predicted GIY-YIG superfamily endonuclease
MLPPNYRQRYENMIIFIEKIWNQPSIKFSELTPSVLNEEGAVYIIALIETDKVLYIGRTVNCRRRLYTNHLMGNQSTARLKKYLIEDPNVIEVTDYPSAKQYLRERCYFKYLPEEDSRTRGMMEGGLAYPLNVRYIEKEH